MCMILETENLENDFNGKMNKLILNKKRHGAL